jgi:hypothetical protein
VIGRDSDVSCSGARSWTRRKSGLNFLTVRICSGGHREIVVEQFAGRVNQMDIHAALISLVQAILPYEPQAGNLEQLLHTQRKTVK